VATTIIGATSMAQLQENIGAYQVKLTDAVLAEIEQIHLNDESHALKIINPTTKENMTKLPLCPQTV